jgi:myo-inositol-1(or 4)-monophosphatase
MGVDVPDTELLETAQAAARLAGDTLQQWVGVFTVSEKRPADLVTEADLAAQEAIHRLIHGCYPDHNFLGEEGLHQTNSDSPYRWIIDPLDGTSNYVHQFPYYAVSIGLECAGVLQVGVILDPNRNELFSAVRGQGATLNGKPIHPTSVDSLRQAMVVASLPVGAGIDDPAVARFLRVLPVAQTVQRTGSAALNLAYVAAGRMDAFFSSSLRPWDVAAGALIVAEAGGRVSKIDGGSLELEVPDLLATNGTTLHNELQRLLA